MPLFSRHAACMPPSLFTPFREMRRRSYAIIYVIDDAITLPLAAADIAHAAALLLAMILIAATLAMPILLFTPCRLIFRADAASDVIADTLFFTRYAA